MPRRLKIKPTDLPSKTERISPSKVDDTQRVSFSFVRLRSKKEKFLYVNKEKEYFLSFLERLKSVSTMTRMEMIKQNGKSLRCHTVNFKDVKVSEDTFGILGEDVDEDAYQFSITSNEHGRVCGYFVGNIFFIVWLDPAHELYPGK